MKKNKKITSAATHTTLKDTRDFVRFMTALLFLPWFGWLTSSIFGFEAEFETEIVVMLTFLLLGTFWCGWICPFGNMSYFMTKIGKKLFPRLQISIPPKFDRPLRHLKYLFLILFVYVMVSTRFNYFSNDHMEMYLSTGFTHAYIVFKKYAILLIPLLIPRFFCKYLCFQKGAYNIINMVFPLSAIHRDEDKCVNCGKCDTVCPMEIKVSESKNIRGSDCIGCWSCVDEKGCSPKIGALSLRFMGRKVSPIYFAALVIPVYYLVTWLVLNL